MARLTPPDGRHFDPATILELVGADRQFRDEVVTMFRHESIRLAEEIQTALAAGDARAMESAAHSIGGMLSYLGPSIAHDLSNQLEACSTRDDLENAGRLVADLCTELELIRQELGRL